MVRRTFGPTGVSVPVIGQGTWNLERVDKKKAIATLRQGLEAGMTHIDTAELYGSGLVEEMVGEAVRGRRDEVFLASKVLPENASYQGTLKACEQSLRRLRTDVLDLYLLHWPGSIPLEETFRAFAQLRSSGKIRHFGVSNFDVGEIERALAIAGEDQIACNQVLYHLLERTIEHEVLPWCESHRVALVGYSPFGSGQFPSESSRQGRVLAEIAKAHRATPRQVALRFLIRDEDVFTIPMTTSPKHAEENAAAAELSLSPEEIRPIDTAFPRGPKRSGLPTL
jgi:diketogulonate reductase-like aldo/keto reductase